MVGVLGLYPGHKDPEMHVTIVFFGGRRVFSNVMAKSRLGEPCDKSIVREDWGVPGISGALAKKIVLV